MIKYPTETMMHIDVVVTNYLLGLPPQTVAALQRLTNEELHALIDMCGQLYTLANDVLDTRV